MLAGRPWWRITDSQAGLLRCCCAVLVTQLHAVGQLGGGRAGNPHTPPPPLRCGDARQSVTSGLSEPSGRASWWFVDQIRSGRRLTAPPNHPRRVQESLPELDATSAPGLKRRFSTHDAVARPPAIHHLHPNQTLTMDPEGGQAGGGQSRLVSISARSRFPFVVSSAFGGENVFLAARSYCAGNFWAPFFFFGLALLQK